MTELIVSLAILSVIATLAIGADTESSANTAAAADHVATELESARLRAMATRRYHRVTFDDRGAAVEAATTTGMAAPTDYDLISGFSLPHVSIVHAAASTTSIAGGATPAAGDALPFEIRFAPDGTATAATLFLSDRRGRSPIRVAVFASTGYARVYEGW